MYERILYAVAWHGSLLLLLLLCTSSCSDPHEMNNNKMYKNCCNEHLEQGYYYCLFPVETEMEKKAEAKRGGSCNRAWGEMIEETELRLRLAAGQRFKDSSLLFGPQKGS